VSGQRLEISALSKPASTSAAEIAARTERELLETVKRLRYVAGSGQEMGGEANGPAVNERRAAMSLLLSRHGEKDLSALLPRVGRYLPKAVRGDLDWIQRAERQPISSSKKIDFGWSKNPMSTPKALSELFELRRESARKLAKEIAKDPSKPFDASDDNLQVALEIDDPDLRAQVLADTLVQLRAKRRSEGLMDATLAPEEKKEQVRGRFGSSGTVNAFEQRLLASSLEEGTSLAKRRSYALSRLVVSNAAAGAVNGIFLARNAVASLSDYLGPSIYTKPIGGGHQVSIHGAIHSSYSADTPRAVDDYLRDRVFTEGKREDRISTLRTLVETARSDEKQKSAILKRLSAQCDLPELKTGDQEGRLRAYELLLTVHRAVCIDRPSKEEIAQELFYAGSAWREVATLVAALEKGDHSAQLEALGSARLALRKAFFSASSGFDRQMLWRLDRKVELLSAEILGKTMAKEPADMAEVLLATRSALRGTIASGLDALRRRKKTAKTEELTKLLTELDTLLGKKSVELDDARRLLGKIYAAASEATDTMRGFFHRREGAIRFSEIDVALDPELSDNLIKESPLHYLLGLAQRGMSHGLKTCVSEDEIRLSSGMRVLSSVGPRVYDRILVAKDPKALKSYSPPPGPNDLVVLSGANPKDLVYGGGLVLDAKHAGPGYSHLAVFAKGHGLSAIALPNLSDAITKFFAKAGGNGFYVDDRPGSFVVKPLESAIEEGLVQKDEVEKLRPGYNLEVDYWDATKEGERVLVAHTSRALSEHHDTRRIDLFVPDLTNELSLDGPASFGALASTPLDLLRQSAGEKGAVLVKMAASKSLSDLGAKVPGGMIISPFIVKELLESAKLGGESLRDVWQKTISDPSFRSDRAARLGTPKSPGVLAKMKAASEKSLRSLLFTKSGAPSAKGHELLSAIAKELPAGERIIARSSFTGEDRPNKSGAGQYSSFPNLESAKERLEGIIGVIASAWNEGAVESNLSSGIALEQIWPSVVLQRCIAPTVSGVAISRGPKGGFGEVSYQAKPKFGGGVDGGAAEEGVLGSGEATLTRSFEGKSGSLLTKAQKDKLAKAVLAIEEEFNRSIEPGCQLAVDVEWAFEGNKLYILQARTIA
jgi:hypothetical protein